MEERRIERKQKEEELRESKGKMRYFRKRENEGWA
jgi:hypothetical protein